MKKKVKKKDFCRIFGRILVKHLQVGYLVVDVGLTQVTPHRQIGEAQHHRMFGHDAVSHHVLVNVTATEHLRQKGEQVRHASIVS